MNVMNGREKDNRAANTSSDISRLENEEGGGEEEEGED